MSEASLADTIRQRLGECSPAERKVARALLAAYPAAGLDTVAKLAERAGTSAPTVIRFTVRMGFTGYPDFQSALRDELEQRDASPLTLYQRPSEPGSEDDILERGAHVFTAAVESSLSALPPDDLRSAVRLLADHGRRVHVLGGRFTHLIAHYLLLHLAQLRGNVQMFPVLPVEQAAALAGSGRKDVFVIFDYRRYEPRAMKVAQRAKERGGRIVLFTDTWLSPVASIADVVLPSHVDAPSPYDSLVPSLALVETTVAAVLAALGEEGREHMLACEEAARDADLY
ncbi:MurR/RpiR family transcriptional regulator [Spirillospora sp. NPDC049024]